ncbi:MAG: hypothetical protein M0041_01425 [Nitrospiraceae bacterium]|nr:hypothetical protein [Nitrospiraceae bacterium]
METNAHHEGILAGIMTSDEIREIRERTEKATPGPWRACHHGECDCGQIWSQSVDVPVLEVVHGEWGDPGLPYGKIPPERATANALFVSHARTDISKLLGHIESLEAKIASLCGKQIPH